MDDLELRLTLSTRLKCHKIAIEVKWSISVWWEFSLIVFYLTCCLFLKTIVSMKDRQRLEEYRKQVERTNPVQSLISNYLQNSVFSVFFFSFFCLMHIDVSSSFCVCCSCSKSNGDRNSTRLFLYGFVRRYRQIRKLLVTKCMKCHEQLKQRKLRQYSYHIITIT